LESAKYLNQALQSTEFNMSKFEYGLKRAVSEVIAGLIIFVIFASFVDAGLISESFVLLFHFLNALLTISMVFVFPFWTTSYSIGWLVGIWLMHGSGLVGALELLLYLVPLIIVVIRFIKKFMWSCLRYLVFCII